MANLIKLARASRWELTSAATLMQFNRKKSSCVCTVMLCPPPTILGERRGILNGDLPSRARRCRHTKHTSAVTGMRLANQLKCGMSTDPTGSFVPCVWKFANLPPSTQQETDRKSVQLFIVFLPVLPQETVPAANGAQQRLHSLVRIRDTHVVRPLTHLRTPIANTAVPPLKWSGVASAAAHILQGQISQQRACGWVPWDVYWCSQICMNC